MSGVSNNPNAGPIAIQCSCGEATLLEEAYYCRKCEKPKCTLCWDEAIDLLYCHDDEPERRASDSPPSTDLTAVVPVLDATIFTVPPAATSPTLQEMLGHLCASAGLDKEATRDKEVRRPSKTTLRCRECATLLYKPDSDPSVEEPKYECRAADHLPGVEARLKSLKMAPS